MIRGHHIAAAVLASAVLVGADAYGIQQPQGFDSGLLSPATVLRTQRTITHQAPRRAARAWERFRRTYPGSWVAHWDAETDVVHRIWGQGIDAPGTVADDQKALAFSEAFLVKHLDLLAPGGSLADFKVVSNRAQNGMRVVGFHQYKDGLRVIGGQLSFRFKNDRLFTIASTASPTVKVVPPTSIVDPGPAQTEGLTWLEAELNTIGIVNGFEGPMILPLVEQGSAPQYRVVMKVEVETKSPVSRWDVYLDAETGAPVAREQTLRFASGTLLYNVPERRPGDTRYDAPAAGAQVQIDGQPATVDPNGLLTFTPASVSVLATTTSSRVNVNNEAGQDATGTLTLNDASSVVWDLSGDQFEDAQLNAFIHTTIAKDFATTITPDLSWVDEQFPVNVNLNDSCNAFYDGQSINFFRESGNCNNTGRLADVVYHEFGHGFHRESVQIGSGAFEGALSEGASDFYSALITADSGMGRGFFKSNQPLRQINPENGEYRWPDDTNGEVHNDGLIIGGTLWDLRELLIAKLGQEAGAAKSAELFAIALRNADDMPSMYTETLAADDDDGNIANGTPNVCEIAEAFGAHGLRDLNIAVDQELAGQTSADGYRVTLEIEGIFDQCENDATEDATIIWRPEEPNAASSTVKMDKLPNANTFEGIIPDQDPGTIVRYQVQLETQSQGNRTFPNNPADDEYQLFVGEVIPLYCTDFETDPEAEGWTHGLAAGEPTDGADDWMWGNPAGVSGSGDPSAAYSGDNVWGNDLGGVIDGQPFNGQYQADKVNFSLSPVVDTQGYTNIRLQYRRWLNVEDGAYDRSRIYGNDQVVWENLASPGQPDPGESINHTDQEWRFHDVDLSSAVVDDQIQVRFELETDPGFETGGWTIDDFCIVAFDGDAVPDPVCGNGQVELGEQCDDGNVIDGDGCTATCLNEEVDEGNPAEPFDPVITGGCGCVVAGETNEDGVPTGLVLAMGLIGAAASRRRRRS